MNELIKSQRERIKEQQKKYDEKLHKARAEQIEFFRHISDDILSIPGIPSNNDLVRIKGDIVFGHFSYERTREAYYLDKNIQYISDKKVETSYKIISDTLNAELGVYKNVPTRELFEHFRKKTILSLEKKKTEGILSFEEDFLLNTLANPEVQSFYDLANEEGWLSIKNSSRMFLENDINNEIDQVDRERINVALSLKYYMQMLGEEDLPCLKLPDYGIYATIKNQSQQKVDTRGILKGLRVSQSQLSGETKGYSYILDCMSRHQKFNNVCEFASKMEPKGSMAQKGWKKLEIPSTFTFPLELQEDLKKISVVTAPSIKVRDDLIRGLIRQGDNAIKVTQAFELVANASHRYALAHQSLHHKNNSPNIEGRSSIPVPPIPNYTYIRRSGMRGWMDRSSEIDQIFGVELGSGLNLQSELEDGFTGVKVLTSFATPGVAIKGVKGFAVGTGIAAGSLIYDPIDEVLDFCLRPVLNIIKEGDVQDAVGYCYTVNQNITSEIRELNEQLHFIQKNPQYENVLEYFYKKYPNDELAKHVKKEQENPFENSFFDRKEIKELYEKYEKKIQDFADEDVDLSSLRTSYKMMLENMLELEEKCMRLALYTYCMNTYENDKSSKSASKGFDQIVEYALLERKTEDNKVLNFIPNQQDFEQTPVFQIDDIHKYIEKRVLFSLRHHEGELKALYELVKNDVDIKETQREPYARIQITHRRKSMQNLMERLGIATADENIQKQAQNLILQQSKWGALPESERVGSGSGAVGFSVDLPLKQNIMINKVRAHLYEMETVHYMFLKSLQSYAQSDDALDFSKISSLFGKRKDRLHNARVFNMPDAHIQAEFKAEFDLLVDMEAVLKTSPHFNIVCQKNGWINDDGHPNLERIAKIPPTRGLKEEMSRADAMEKRVLSLITEMDMYRKIRMQEEQSKLVQVMEMRDGTEIKVSATEETPSNEKNEIPVEEKLSEKRKKKMPELLIEAANLRGVRGVTALIEKGATQLDLNTALEIVKSQKVHPALRAFQSPFEQKSTIAILKKAGAEDGTELPLDSETINQKDAQGLTPLMLAAKEANIAEIKRLLKQGADISLTDNRGQTALSIVFQEMRNPYYPKNSNYDYEYCAKLLIEAGSARVVTEEGRNLYALVEAIYDLDVKKVQEISSKMPRLNIQTPEGESPFIALARVTTSNTSLSEPGYSKKIEKVDKILTILKNRLNQTRIGGEENNWEIEMTGNYGSWCNSRGETPLLILCQEMQQLMVGMHDPSIKRDALEDLAIKLCRYDTVNCVDEKGNTPLHYACMLGLPKLTEILIKSEAKLNVENKLGQTPHDLGVRYNTMGIFLNEEEMKKGCIPAHPLNQVWYQQKCNSSRHAWKFSYQSGERMAQERPCSYKEIKSAAFPMIVSSTKLPTEFVQQKTKALIEELGKDNPSEKTVKALLDQGADANALFEEGVDLLGQAVYMERLDIVKVLVDKGAKVDQRIIDVVEEYKKQEDFDEQKLNEISDFLQGKIDNQTNQPDLTSRLGLTASFVEENIQNQINRKER